MIYHDLPIYLYTYLLTIGGFPGSYPFTVPRYPAVAFTGPFLGQPMLMQQGVHVAVAVGPRESATVFSWISLDIYR